MNTIPFATGAPLTVNLSVAPQVFWTEFDISGSYFTGLSLQTTLTVNWNVYVERFPTQLDIDLVLLAAPSPPYDIQALEFISECMRLLPPGVMVAENGLGDWFADVLQTGADYVAPLLANVPHPYAQGISAALTGGAKMVGQFRSKPKAERQAINSAAKKAVKRMGAQIRGNKPQKKAAAKARAKGKKFQKKANAPSTWVTTSQRDRRRDVNQVD